MRAPTGRQPAWTIRARVALRAGRPVEARVAILDARGHVLEAHPLVDGAVTGAMLDHWRTLETSTPPVGLRVSLVEPGRSVAEAEASA